MSFELITERECTAENPLTLTNALSVDISEYQEVTIFLNHVKSNNDSAAIAIEDGDKIYTGYIGVKTKESNCFCMFKNMGRTLMFTHATSNPDADQGVALNTIIPKNTKDFPIKTETITIKTSASAWTIVGGTIEVWGRK